MLELWTAIGVAFVVWFMLVVLFTPRIDYQVSAPLPPESDEFLRVIQPAGRVVASRSLIERRTPWWNKPCPLDSRCWRSAWRVTCAKARRCL